MSASFTDEQRRIYRIVLEAQNAALAQVRPGATFRELNRAARDVIGDDVMRRVLRELDLERILLDSRDPVVEPTSEVLIEEQGRSKK